MVDEKEIRFLNLTVFRPISFIVPSSCMPNAILVIELERDNEDYKLYSVNNNGLAKGRQFYIFTL